MQKERTSPNPETRAIEDYWGLASVMEYELQRRLAMGGIR